MSTSSYKDDSGWTKNNNADSKIKNMSDYQSTVSHSFLICVVFYVMLANSKYKSKRNCNRIYPYDYLESNTNAAN
jgi:hypothetical protein